jgi:hypothetical protein
MAGIGIRCAVVGYLSVRTELGAYFVRLGRQNPVLPDIFFKAPPQAEPVGYGHAFTVQVYPPSADFLIDRAYWAAGH